MDVPAWLVVLLGVLATLAGATTVWSVWWDVRAYGAWKREQTEPQPRHERRRKRKRAEEEASQAKRWRWIMRAMSVALMGFGIGVTGLVVGFMTRTAWTFVVGGNFLVVGVVAWTAYQLILPKPDALRQKRWPNWLSKRIGRVGG